MRIKLRFWYYVGIAVFLICVSTITFLVLQDAAREKIIPNIFDAFSDEFDKNPPQWEECQLNLSNIKSKVIFLRKPAHPFLAEYYRKIRFDAPGKQSRLLELPMNTGGLTNILVFLFEHENKEYVRMRDRNLWNIVIDIEGAEISEEEYPEKGELVGALMAVTGELEYIDVHENPEHAYEVFTDAAKRGYEKPLKALEAMKVKE